MRYIFSSFIFLFVLLTLHSCKQMPNDGIPFYLKIDTLTVLDANGHPVTNHVTDIWAEANATTLGAFELPCNFPVLAEDTVHLVLTAGIYQDGDHTNRVTYPYYQPDTLTLIAARGQKYSHAPVFRYISGTAFVIDESFEAGNSFTGITKTYNSGVSSAYYGLSCGVISVDANDSNVVATQTHTCTLTAGQEIWLEFDYKSEIPFNVGFYANYSGLAPVQVPETFIVPNTQWTRVYVKLSEEIASASATSYQIYFEALRPYGTTSGSVYLDNVRLVDGI